MATTSFPRDERLAENEAQGFCTSSGAAGRHRRPPTICHSHSNAFSKNLSCLLVSLTCFFIA